MNPDDEAIVASQLGRSPRGRWRVAARCRHGASTVVAVAPLLEDGSPFPTTFWLTCPALVGEVRARESAGEQLAWTERALSDPELAASMATAARAYRDARAGEAGGSDPCAHTGVAGERDALRVKCLHARVAAHLAGLTDPVGAAYAADCDRILLRCDGSPCVCTPGADVR